MDYYGNTFWAPTEVLMHHGIRGMRWGVRRYQNEDGSLTAAGQKRYGDGGSPKKVSKAERKEIRNAYRQAQKKRYKEYDEINRRYDAKRTENTWGLDSGNASNRLKNHLKNEYSRQKAINNWNQKNLDAKREYRIAMGKKKADTWLMKMSQKQINDISSQTQAEFNRDYIKNLYNNAYSSLRSGTSYVDDDD